MMEFYHTMKSTQSSSLPPDDVPVGVGAGVSDLRSSIAKATTISSPLLNRRAAQYESWMWSHISDKLLNQVRNSPRVCDALPLLEQQVCAGIITPGMAADYVLAKFTRSVAP